MDEPQNETKCSQLLKKECEEFCFSFRYFVGPHFLLRHSRGRGADEKHEHYAHASLAGSPIVFNLRSFFYILFIKSQIHRTTGSFSSAYDKKPYMLQLIGLT